MRGLIAFSTFFAFWFAVTSSGSISRREDAYSENIRKLALANNELAFNLHRKLVSGSSENVFFSPLSISTAFGMLFYGARGDTAQELRQALGYEKADLPNNLVHDTFNSYLSELMRRANSSDGYVLNAANAVLVDEKFDLLDEYRRNVQELYRATVRDVDFVKEAPRIVEEINNWVKEKTNGKIEKLLDELDPSTVLVLLNAVYFKGTWKIPFDKEITEDGIFYNNGLESEQRKVPFMHLTFRFRYASEDNFQVLELPYKGDNSSMLVLLPNERDGLQDLEESLTPERLDDIQRRLYRTKVDVSLPKFKLQFEKELSPAVKALGANEIFGSADFSGMASRNNAKVSKIVHKAVIEVNEEGSEAAAVTGIVVVAVSAYINEPPVPQFKADHPFLFAILEKGSKSNIILFLGRVNNL